MPTTGERIDARFVDEPSKLTKKRAALLCTSSLSVELLPEASVDLVATDPPYYANVAYSELLDFNYAWLRVPETRFGVSERMSAGSSGADLMLLLAVSTPPRVGGVALPIRRRERGRDTCFAS
jgi:hypothetical protein